MENLLESAPLYQKIKIEEYKRDEREFSAAFKSLANKGKEQPK